MNIDIINLLLLTICCAEMGWQLQISSLAYKVKALLGLLPDNSKLQVLCKRELWTEFIGFWYVIPTTVFKSWRFISELLNCPYCSTYHMSWISIWLILQQPLWLSLVLAPLGLVWVAVLDRIHFK